MTQGMDQPDPLVGQTIAGKYKIVRLLGEGGMGCVYLGEQMLGSTTRKVAVKTLHKHLSHDPSIKARFQREVGTVAALEHPNTIQVFDFGAMEDGTLYIVMEYVQGKSVADVLEKEGAMPPARVDNIFRQVTGSLEEAHNQGIVHRDLKPDNVLLCERAGTKDWVEVLDFGIAKRSSEQDPNEQKLTQQGMVLGTPPYMSPEQFTGQPVDTRTDIYALGVMAYEMLTGKYPFEANTAWEWASKHMTEPPRPIETQPLGANVPDKMRFAIMRCLAKNKEERFATVREFFDAFTIHAPGGTNVEMAPMSLGGGAGAGAGGPPPRAKTEMAGPSMGGGPPPMTPPYGQPVSAGGMGPPGAGMGGMGGPAMVPVAPPRGAGGAGGSQGGGMGLIIGLGALAVVLLGGGGIAYWASTRTKTVDIVPTATTTATVTSATASSATDDTSSSSSGGAVAPLDAGSTYHPTGSSGVAPAHDAGKTGPVPTPHPEPPKTPEPAVCQEARNAAARHSPIAPTLEAQCRKAGGKI